MQHLAMIMDGNRRWAKSRKLKAVTLGHRKGVDTVKTAISFCLKKGIKYLSLYVFSIENFNRPEEEKKYIFNLLVEVLKDGIADFIKQEIRVRFLGERDLFPASVLPTIKKTEEKTKDLDKLHLSFLFCYGAKQEVVYAAKSLAKKVKDGFLNFDDIDENMVQQELWTSELPNPDLIVRTSGISRLSNFLLFQAAYSELMFLDCYWPEINEVRLQQCVDNFYKVQRNFGK